MSAETYAASTAGLPRSSVVWLILRIGLIAGTFDILDNLIFNQFRGVTPKMVFQYIASGLLGMKSFQGGSATIVLGVLFHYLIATIWTAIFFVARDKLAGVRQRPVIGGLLYGGFVYLFMNFVVLPLSRVPRAQNPMTIASRINGVLAVIIFIGLTISLLMSRNSAPNSLRSSSR